MFRRAMVMTLGMLLVVLAVPSVGATPAAAEPVSAVVLSIRGSDDSHQVVAQGTTVSPTGTGGVNYGDGAITIEPAVGAQLSVGRVDFPAGGAGSGPTVSVRSVCSSTDAWLQVGYLDVREVAYGPDGRVTSLAADLSVACTSRAATVQVRLASEVPYVAVAPDNDPTVVNTITGRPARATTTFTNRGPVTVHPSVVLPSGATVVSDGCSGSALVQAASCAVVVDATQTGYVRLAVPELAALEAGSSAWAEPVRYWVVVNQWAAPDPVRGLRAFTAAGGVGLSWDHTGSGGHFRVEQRVGDDWVILENATSEHRYGADLAAGATATFRVTPGSEGGLDPSGAATVQGVGGGLTFPTGAKMLASLDGAGVLAPSSVVPSADRVTINSGRAWEPSLTIESAIPGTPAGTYALGDGQAPVSATWGSTVETAQRVTGTVTITRAQYSPQGVPQEFAAVLRGTRQSQSGAVPVSAVVLLNSVPTGLPGYLAADPGSVATRVPVGIDQTFPIALRNLGGAAIVVPAASVVSTHVVPQQPTAWTVSTSCTGTSVASGGSCAAAVRVVRPQLDSPGYPLARATWKSGSWSAAVDLNGDWGDGREAPTVGLTVPATSGGDLSVTFRAADPQAGDTVSAHCRLDGGAFVTCHSPWALKGLSAGPHTVTVYATDQVGNMSTWVRGSTKVARLTTALVADGHPDLMVRLSSGELGLYRGNGKSGFLARQSIGKGFDAYTKILSPGDFTRDGRPDVIGAEPDGSLWLHSGSATTARQRIGSGWQIYNRLVAPGDFSGDGRPDLIGRAADGGLWLYRGNGTGGWTGSRAKIGSGWGIYASILPAGDFTGDGRADLMAIDTAGSLYLYRGNGLGGFTGSRTRIGTGWGAFTAVVTGDYSGDRKTDVVARSSTGALYLYRGNGAGGFLSARTTIGSGWQGFDVVTGVR